MMLEDQLRQLYAVVFGESKYVRLLETLDSLQLHFI